MMDSSHTPLGQRSDIPSFHDGYLTGVSVYPGSSTLSLRNSEGDKFQLHMFGVEGFRADEFLAGNIILDVEVFQGGSPNRAYLNARLVYLFPPPYPSTEQSYHLAHQKRLDELAERICSGELALVNVDPTYGCRLVALCAEVRLVALSGEDNKARSGADHGDSSNS